MQPESPGRHDGVHERGELVVVAVGDVEVGERGAEEIVRVGFAGENRLDVDPGVVVEQREDERCSARIIEDDSADDVGAAVAEEPGGGHLDLDGPACVAVEYGLESFRDQPHVAFPVTPGLLEARDFQDAIDERCEIRAVSDGKIDPYRRGALARGLALVQKSVIHRLPHAFVHHSPRGMDIGEGNVRFVTSFDQGEIAGLDTVPERLVLGGRRQCLAQAPCERVDADAVDGESPEAQVQGCGGITSLEGGLG